MGQVALMSPIEGRGASGTAWRLGDVDAEFEVGGEDLLDDAPPSGHDVCSRSKVVGARG